MRGPLVGTKRLVGATLKHDGRKLAPWILIVTALSVSSILIYDFIFPNLQDRQTLAAAVGGNPAMGLIFGPAHDLTTADGFNAWRSLALGGFLTAIGMTFAVTRNSRLQEDSGQAELLASGVLGRYSRLTTAMIVGLIGSFAVGFIAALGTWLSRGDFETSFLLGATFTATGFMFTGVAAVTSQLASDARSANSMAIGTLGVLFVARGFLYSMKAPTWTYWIVPLGWMTETKPAFTNNWWPLLPALGLTLVLLGVAFALQRGRDFGFGAIAPKPGPEHGTIRTPFRLAVRLNRSTLIAWTIGFVALGFVFGFFATSVPDLLGGDSAVQNILAAGATTPAELISAFTVTIMSLAGIVASISGVQIVLKMRTDELDDRVEPIIVAGGSRVKYYLSNVAVALIGPAVSMLVAGLIIGIIAHSAGIGVSFGDVFAQAVLTIVATWAVIGISVLVVGARPRLTIAGWAGVLLSFVLTVLGPSFKLPNWALAVSPFWHVPKVAAASQDWVGFIVVALVACVLIGAGTRAFTRRDLTR